jgi:hypothetical protein
MLARILFVSFTITTLHLFSQDKHGLPKLNNSNEYWSVGYYGSGNLSIVNEYAKEDAVQPGYGVSLELFYNDNKHNFLLIISGNRINQKGENRHFETIEISTGPRFKLSKTGDLFAEFTLGGIMVSRVAKYYDYGYHFYTPYEYVSYKSDPHFSFGLTGAIGKKFNLTQNNDFVLKLRMLTTVSFNEKFFTYLTATGGITFNTKKYVPQEKSPLSYVSIALLGGGNYPGTLSQWEYDWGQSYGLEVTYRASPKIELLLDGNYNKIYRTYADVNNYGISVTAGGRFLINENPATAFFEIGGGLYSFVYQGLDGIIPEPVSYVQDYPGINFGTGTRLKLTNLMALLIKGNLHFLFVEEPFGGTPDYFTLQGGLRFNL